MLYLSGIFLSFFLSLILITKKGKNAADYLLLSWISITGFHLLTFYLFSTNQVSDYPTIIGIGLTLPLVQGPFLYLYTRQQTTARPFKGIQLLHFLPVILANAIFIKFYLLSHEQKVEVFQQNGQGFKWQSAVNLYAIYISGIVYITLSFYHLLKYRKNLVNQFSNTEKINFNWLLYLIVWMMAIWIIILVVRNDSWTFGAAALFILWLGFFGIKQVQVFSQHKTMMAASPIRQGKMNSDANADKDVVELNPAESPAELKYQKSSLSDEDANRIHDRLNEALTHEKPFKNPELTLNDLAEILEVHPNHLSQVINSRENKNFYDLINEKRVEEFIEIILKPESQQFTLLALAFDCGFNSKASFNRNFKKYTGRTPSEFLKQKLVA